MFDRSVNATRSLKKETDWSGPKKANSSEEAKLSYYQSKEKMYIWAYVKFGGRLSISYGRKMRYKKGE
jgi:hypothetical protein